MLYFTVYPDLSHNIDILILLTNGPALAIADAEVTAVSGNVNITVAVELIASVETVIAAMLTCSQSNIRSHSH